VDNGYNQVLGPDENVEDPENAVIPGSIQLPVRTIHLSPTMESLPIEEQGLSEDSLLEKYITPHFAATSATFYAGAIHVLDGVTWRVNSCHPPFGYNNADTEFIVESPVVTETPLLRAHVLPVLESDVLV